MQRPPFSTRDGYSLFEIAIVLAVASLIVAGLVLGRGLTENAALQSVVADYDTYRTAALAYRDKYKELPGDHAAATSLTSADAGCPTPTASNTPTDATCNGNGDGIIGDSTGNPLGAFTAYQESLLAWQHLRNDGLLPGKYNGRRSTATNEITFGVNVPHSKIGDASFILRSFPTNTFTTGYFKADYGHVFFFGQPGSAANLPFNTGALTTERAKAIDQKIDDGMPGMGKVLTSHTTCASSTVESTATYNGAQSGNVCALIFITGF